MILFSPKYNGIRWLLDRYGIREYLDQELVPLFTPSPPYYPEGLTN